MLRKCVIWFVIVFLVCGCGIVNRVVESGVVCVDTVYIAKHQLDSVYVADRERVYVVCDTVYVERVSERYRYRVRVDTIYQSKVDSIVVVREVPYEVVKSFVPGIVRVFAWVGVVAIVLLLFWLLWKLRVL